MLGRSQSRTGQMSPGLPPSICYRPDQRCSPFSRVVGPVTPHYKAKTSTQIKVRRLSCKTLREVRSPNTASDGNSPLLATAAAISYIYTMHWGHGVILFVVQRPRYVTLLRSKPYIDKNSISV
jgi:hypothetical protein